MGPIRLTSVLVFLIAMPVEAKVQYLLRAQPTAGQNVTWQHGDQFLQDPQQNSSVAFAQVRRTLPDKQSAFQIYVLNKSGTPFTFGPENIEIECPDGSRVRMASYDALAGKARRDIKRRQTFAMIGTALQAANANGMTGGNVEVSGMVGGTVVSGTAHYSVYDPALARAQQEGVREQAAATAQAIQSRASTAGQALDEMIQTTTVFPGKSFGGIVAYEPPAAFGRSRTPLTVHLLITAGNEQHVVIATVGPLP